MYLVAPSFATSTTPRTDAPNLRAARALAARLSLTGRAHCVHRATERNILGSVVAEYQNGHPVT